MVINLEFLLNKHCKTNECKSNDGNTSGDDAKLNPFRVHFFFIIEAWKLDKDLWPAIVAFSALFSTFSDNHIFFFKKHLTFGFANTIGLKVIVYHIFINGARTLSVLKLCLVYNASISECLGVRIHSDSTIWMDMFDITIGTFQVEINIIFWSSEVSKVTLHRVLTKVTKRVFSKKTVSQNMILNDFGTITVNE